MHWTILEDSNTLNSYHVSTVIPTERLLMRTENIGTEVHELDILP